MVLIVKDTCTFKRIVFLLAASFCVFISLFEGDKFLIFPILNVEFQPTFFFFGDYHSTIVNYPTFTNQSQLAGALLPASARSGSPSSDPTLRSCSNGARYRLEDTPPWRSHYSPPWSYRSLCLADGESRPMPIHLGCIDLRMHRIVDSKRFVCRLENMRQCVIVTISI
jgi:hypothetical protein